MSDGAGETPFQVKCVQAIRLCLAAAGYRREVPFERIGGKDESYFKATIAHASRSLEFFVYEDEAGFLVNGRDWHISERADFRNEEELLRDLLEALTRVLTQD
jgi:hypothetical protein